MRASVSVVPPGAKGTIIIRFLLSAAAGCAFDPKDNKDTIQTVNKGKYFLMVIMISLDTVLVNAAEFEVVCTGLRA
jgi:hypothetical protein